MFIRVEKGSMREAEGTPGGMLIYGTVVTVLLVLFVGAYSFSAMDAQKNKGYPAQGAELQDKSPSPGTEDTQDYISAIQPLQGMTALDEQMKQIYLQVKNFITENGLEQEVEVRYEEQGVVLDIKEKILFDSGKADLKPEARTVLGTLTRLLSKLPYPVRVEGHTDNRPFSSAKYPTVWELSAARASGVVRYFTEFHGLDPAKFAAVGYGGSRPVKPNSSPENRALNRRMQLVIYAFDVYEKEVSKLERNRTQGTKGEGGG
ncbi:MAG: OmpA family protein [Bacillota bacterium]